MLTPIFDHLKKLEEELNPVFKTPEDYSAYMENVHNAIKIANFEEMKTLISQTGLRRLPYL